MSRTNWNTDKYQKLLKRYQELNLIPFSCSLSEKLKKDENGDMVPKKEFENLPSHSKITKFKQDLIKTYNGLCIKIGTKINDSDYVILVDVDNKNDTINKWNRLLKIHHKTTNLKTPTATTGNSGLHYLFKISEDKYNKIQKSYTTLTIKVNNLI